MYRLTVGAVGDLVTAGRAVSHDQCAFVGLAHRRQQRELGHGDRRLIMLGLVAEAARHAAATRLDWTDGEVGYEGQCLLYRAHGAERLLVAMAMQQRGLLRQRLELELEPPRLLLAREKLLEQERIVRCLARRRAQAQREEFIA